MPGYEREYVNLMRDRELKNELYIFLLQKKESSLLNLTSSVTPSFVIDEAYSATKPSYKKPLLVTIACLLMALLLPLLWVLWRMKRKNTVQNAYDLPKEWEKHTIELTSKKGKNHIKDVRAALMQNNRKKVLVIPFNHEAKDLVNELASSLNNIEQPCRIFTVNDTDQLLAGDTCNAINQTVENGEYALVELPVDSNLGEIADLLADDNTMLMLAIEKGKTKRNQFTQAIQGIEPNNHISVI